MANNSPGNRKDPLPVFCFKVDLAGMDGISRGEAFFKSCSGLKYETEVVDFKEGGLNSGTHKLVGSTKWANIVLKRGFTGSSKLLDWREGWINGTAMSRVKGTIVQLDTTLVKELAKWEFYEAWPCKWELNEFDGSKNELSIETLELAHAGLKKVG